jgi:hypothetical protein
MLKDQVTYDRMEGNMEPKISPVVKWVALIFFIIPMLVGCATSGKLMNLKLNMTKSEVISNIGKPTAARGSLTNKYDQIIEIWEYTLWKGPVTADYWLYFVDNRLVQWGEAGDWQKEADRIYELRFKPWLTSPK